MLVLKNLSVTALEVMHSAQAAKIAKVICWFYESILGVLGVGAVQEPKVGFYDACRNFWRNSDVSNRIQRY